MALDHYTVQFLTGHGDFNAKLASHSRSNTVMFRCTEGHETVEHVLYDCRLNNEDRERLKSAVIAVGEEWPCRPHRFVESRGNYFALSRFAKEVICRKREYTYNNVIRRQRLD